MLTTIAAMQVKKAISPMRNFDPIKDVQAVAVSSDPAGQTPATRAQLAFAPQDNDVPAAIDYMRQFFAQVKIIHHEDFDPIEAARAEVGGWVALKQAVS